MITGGWRCGRKIDAQLEICCVTEPIDKPCTEPEKAQRWRVSLASLLFFTALLFDHLWLCAGGKLRSRDRTHRRTWNNASHYAQAGLRDEDCGVLLNNLTENGPECVQADAPRRAPLESACSTLYRQKSGSVGSSYSVLVPTMSPHAFLEYFRNFSLPFCDALTIADLLESMTSPDGMNCNLARVIRDLFSGGPEDGDVCSACVHAYIRLDQHAQEKYEEFNILTHKYMADDYSVRAHTRLCQAVYKAWLCAEYFPVPQRQCVKWLPCKHYCGEVTASCPYILPDNDRLLYAGLPSFLCAELQEEYFSSQGPDCCDVRWSGCDSVVGSACALTHLPGSFSLHRRLSSGAVSWTNRLHGSKLKLCVLVLFLIQTVISITNLQHCSTGSLETIVPHEEVPMREE
ncbi:NALCN channel auxiliary factor 2-like isoform X1 [Myxocyprinus asiaticus]|uniref:NALCN channel auxiliary factor 2-like isoform X1 n=1 Tax=Myxocyprinus asiaticus TaxID=70543 RepID=UPI0022237496|nr:NALCN channel auxiliary factor 2-like isoform X1 [Myxocyprinus asiaticus]